MFLRVVTARGGRYLQLCQSVRVNGVPKHQVLHSFGNLDRIPRSTLVALSDKFAALAGDGRPRASALVTERVREYGAAAVAMHLWEQFGLTERLRRLWSGKRRSFDPLPYLQLIVANRLVAPRSKLGVHGWAERVAIPAAEQVGALQHYYRALDALLEVKQPLEEELWAASRDLFNLELDLVFYDLTSTYFEGAGPAAAAYGYSRDHRPDREQVVLALACDRHGFPIAHEVLPGNRADVTTLVQALEMLRGRFTIRRCVFVADSGLVSQANLQALDDAGYGYVVAVKHQQLPGLEVLAATPLAEFAAAGHRLKILLGQADERGRRLVCCYSERRAEEQQQIRQARIDRARTALAKLQQTVARGTLKAPHKIVARAARHLALAKATRYFTYAAQPGSFSFQERQDVLAAQAARDGRYFLLAKAPSLEPTDIVDAYYTLQEVERAFRDMKDFLKLRPIYHWTDRRVRGHVFACVLAYLLEKALGAQLDRAGVKLSARCALDQLSTLHLVDSRLGDTMLRSVSRPAPQLQTVLNAVGLVLPATLSWSSDQAAPPLASTRFSAV